MFKHLLRDPSAGRAPAADPGPTDCGNDPVQALKTMFVDVVMGRRLAAGQAPALRPVFLKTHGVAIGTFTVRKNLPDELRVGVFAHAAFPAVVRFSSDTLPSRPDLKTTVGVAIKLIGVPGRKLLAEDAPTCDFLLQNHDVFFVDTARDMCEFTHAGVIDGDYSPYLKAHPATDRILQDMEKEVQSVLGESYWGLLPHQFGDGRFVKYKLAPAAALPAGPAADPAGLANYLYVDLKSRLFRADAEFHFFVQLRKGDDAMPLDRATVRWDEAASPPVHVATLTLPRQNIDAPGRAAYGENLAFNIWQTLPEHEPQGSIAVARKVAYHAAAQLRRTENHVSTAEPTKPEPAPAPPASQDTTIVRAEIHPAIGVARVGNSEESFPGPEVKDPKPQAAGFYKDSKGALRRQEARFRLYGFNKAGQVVAELTADNATVEWTVHVANKKAAWYNFTLAMDRPAVFDRKVEPARRRNSNVKGADRQQLVIDPGPRTIHGRDTAGSTYRFDTGKFLGRAVYLGELRTDGAGRLIFVGGRGISRSAYGAQPFDFANNDGWHDDTSDGPVSARVWIDGREIPVESAWVLTAPPNYAPELKSVRTMYDLLEDRFRPELAAPVSFTRHVLPIFERITGLQWVNDGFAEQFGWGGPNEFLRPDYLARLAKKGPGEAEIRKQILNSFRNYATNNGWRGLWPWMYGDTMDVDGSAHMDLALSNLQLERLGQWASGDFQEDYNPKYVPPRAISQVPLAEQPEMLTRAALEFCLADAFHPGCEIGWVVRSPWLFRSGGKPPLFRFRVRPASAVEPDYGEVLTPQMALASSGPLNSLGPGDLTRWMAVPWQTDTASCRSGYEGFTPATPTFWPARVPNQVLTEEEYKKVLDQKLSAADRWAAFRTRLDWLRAFGRNWLDSVRRMVEEFGDLGVVERRPGPGDPAFPTELLVESLPTARPVPAPRPLAAAAPGQAVKPEEAPAELNPKAFRFRVKQL